jgi:hypothetical protein
MYQVGGWGGKSSKDYWGEEGHGIVWGGGGGSKSEELGRHLSPSPGARQSSFLRHHNHHNHHNHNHHHTSTNQICHNHHHFHTYDLNNHHHHPSHHYPLFLHTLQQIKSNFCNRRFPCSDSAAAGCSKKEKKSFCSWCLVCNRACHTTTTTPSCMSPSSHTTTTTQWGTVWGEERIQAVVRQAVLARGGGGEGGRDAR